MLASINTLQPSSSRPRSNTASSANIPNGIARANTNDVPQPQSEAPRVRPPHLRSRSYLSPVDAKGRYTLTTPTSADSVNGSNANRDLEREKDRDKEKSRIDNLHRPWKHLPGHRRHAGEEDEKSSHVLVHRRSHGHRHTRSELPTGSKSGGGMSTGEEGSGVDGGRTSSEFNNANDGLLHPAVANLRAGMLTRMATNLSSRNPYTHPHAHTQQKPHRQHSNSNFHSGWSPTAQAPAGSGGLRPDIRRRATSDPKTPIQRYSSSGRVYTRDGGAAQFIGYGHGGGTALYDYTRYGEIYPPQPERKPMTEIEVLLYKAEKAQKEAEASVTEMDVQWLTTQLAESNVELQVQLARNNRTASDLTRRLDDAHDALLSAASSLNDTISSFQNLVTQSKTLNENFERKAKELDKNTRKALEKQKKELFDARGEQVTRLEERGRKANEKAEELSQRLENCRMIVRNFQEREQTKKRAWKGVLMGSLWGCSLIVFGLLLGFGLWWWKNYKDVVQYDVHEALALTFDRKGLGHLHADGGGGKRKDQLDIMNETERAKAFENVPEDVKAVLQDIANRHEAARHPQKRAGSDHTETKTQHFVQPSSDAQVEDDKKLKKLFERLEL